MYAGAPTTVATSSLVAGWLIFRESTYRYEFSYPSQGTIAAEGVSGFPSDEMPPNMTPEEYLAELRQKMPGNLCVVLSYGLGFLAIQPAENRDGAYTGPCSGTGVGDYDVSEHSENLVVDGEVHVAQGFQVRERTSEASLRGEFLSVSLMDGTRIDYGGAWVNAGETYEDYLSAKAVLLRVLESYRRIEGRE
jgi:hypothetical protein